MAEKTKARKEKIIGIDLGTSNSAAAVLQAGKPAIIPSAEGTTAYGKAFPSVVAFTKDTQLLVGEPARRQAISNPGRTITAANICFHSPENKKGCRRIHWRASKQGSHNSSCLF